MSAALLTPEDKISIFTLATTDTHRAGDCGLVCVRGEPDGSTRIIHWQEDFQCHEHSDCATAMASVSVATWFRAPAALGLKPTGGRFLATRTTERRMTGGTPYLLPVIFSLRSWSSHIHCAQE